jgi:hypothetical protein
VEDRGLIRLSNDFESNLMDSLRSKCRGEYLGVIDKVSKELRGEVYLPSKRITPA